MDAPGNSHGAVYDLGGNPIMSIDALNRTNVTAGFDSSGNMITLSDIASGVLTQFNYDSNGNGTGSSNRWVNPNNPSDVHSITNLHVFDAQNREISRSDSNGKQSAVAYNEVGAQSQITDEYGKITGWMYDSRGNLLQIAHSDGTISQMVYDDENRLTVTDDNHQPGSIANGTRMTLDAAGQVIKSERLTNVTINILPDGVASRSVLASFAGVIGTTTYGYDLAGRQIAMTNAFGSVTRYEFDKAGHQTAVIDALNNRTDYAFDAAGRLVATTNALGRVTRTEYDPLGRPVRTIYPDGTSSGTAYNALGQRLSETNQLGLVTDFEYASSGNLSAIVKPQVFDPEGGTNARPRFEFDYDSYAQLAVARDPKRHETHFTNDFLGRVVARALPLGQTARQVFDGFGRLNLTIDFKGQSNEFIFNSTGQLATNRFYPAGSGVSTGAVAFVYDTQNRISQVIEPRGTNSFGYDNQGRVTSITSPEGILNYEYEPIEGRRTRIYTTNSDLRYAFDELGRIKTVSVIKRDRITLPVPEVTTNTYTALGSLENVYYANGIHAFYQYDLMNRLTNLVYTGSGGLLLAQYRYTAGNNGQWQASTEIVRQVNGTYATNQIAWNYDNLGRLVVEKWSSTLTLLNFTNAYVYNVVGNRLWKTNISGAATEIVSYTYNTNDQLLVENSNVSGSFTNWYDLNGALTNRTSSIETNYYAYNLQNRLASATVKRLEAGVQLSETINFTTDYKGNRVRGDWSRSVNGGTSTNGTNIFLNEPNSPGGLHQVIEELPGIGAMPTVSYALGTRILSQSKGGVISHLLPDGHGSTRQLADSNAVIAARYTFDAYGKGIDFTNAVQNPTATGLLYSGGKLDADLQQYFQQARYYLAGMGRFNQIDRLSGSQQTGENLYNYCSQDPVNNSDPTGLYEIDVHQFLTTYLATKAGFDRSLAGTIGESAQGPDGVVRSDGTIDQSRSAYHDGKGDETNMRLYHFVIKPRLVNMAFSASVSQMRGLGEFLHAQEDTYAHSDFEGDRSFEYYGNFYGLTDNGGFYGHFFHGHNPDQTWRDQTKAMKMARKVYQDLKAIYGNPNKTYPRPATAIVEPEEGIPDPVWDGMRGDLQKFVNFPPNVIRENYGYNEQVTFGGYNTKIKLLDPSFGINQAYRGGNGGLPDEVGFKSGTFFNTKAKSVGNAIGNSFNQIGDLLGW